MADSDGRPRRHTRRAFLGAAGAATGLAGAALSGWTPAFEVPADAAGLPMPRDFPASIRLHQQAYRNWSGQLDFDKVWTAVPATPEDVVVLANWARGAGFRLRAKGKQHNWSPLLLSPGTGLNNVVLVDTTAHLTGLRVTDGSPATVTAQTGVTIDDLLARLERGGYGLLASTAAGNLSLGGVLAIDGHGTGIPLPGETTPHGGSHGSLANLVLSLTAVVWDPSANKYVLKTFQRHDPDIGAFLVHLGRAFITEATLQVIPNQRVRCQSRTDVSAAELFGRPGSSRSTLDSYLDVGGRVEALWFPHTDAPWLKVWQVCDERPKSATKISQPYPYVFTNAISKPASDLVKTVNLSAVAATPLLMAAELGVASAGLAASGTADVWGWSKNSLLYARPTTLRIVQASWAVVTSRAAVQQVVHDFYVQYRDLLAHFSGAGRFPVNAPLEIRITGLDQPDEVAASDAVTPLLSAVRPRPDHPEWDTCVWLSPGTLPGTPDADKFFTELETWVWQHYSGDQATVRPEWSKAWAHSPRGAWTNDSVLGTAIPQAFRAGQPDGANWDTAVATLQRHDPHEVFTNPFLRNLLR